MPTEPTEYITTDAAGERLGVHGNTIYKMLNLSIIKGESLPNSGYRRIPVTEIERLEKELAGKRVTARELIKTLLPKASAGQATCATCQRQFDDTDLCEEHRLCGGCHPRVKGFPPMRIN